MGHHSRCPFSNRYLYDPDEDIECRCLELEEIELEPEEYFGTYDEEEREQP